MRLYCSLFAASLPQVAEAFFVPTPSMVSFRNRNTLLFGYLDEINELGPVVEKQDAAVQFDEYMAKVEAAFSRVQKKMGKMKTNERRSQEAVQAVEERMKHQEAELTNKLEVTQLQVSNIRIEAERERQAVIDRHRAREERLEFETENLLRQLEAEKKNMAANKELIQQTLIEKNKLDSELAQIKEKFNTETATYQAEREARRSEFDNLQKSAQLQADQAEQRIADLQMQLAKREQEKEEAILAIQKEMKAREYALMDDLKGIKDEYLRREQTFQAEIASLKLQFETAKETIRINQEMTAKLVSQRVSLDAELGKMKKMFEQESQQWDAKYAQEQEARREEMMKAHQEMLQLQERTEAATAEAEGTKESLLEQLAFKEKQKHAAVAAVKEELHAREKQFKAITEELGAQLTQTKIDANLREIAIRQGQEQRELQRQDAEKAREAQLRNEVNAVRALLEAEQQTLRINQDLTRRILKQRVEIDAELGELKRRYERDSKKWDTKYAKEQEKRRVDKIISRHKLEELHDSAETALRDAWERQVSLQNQLNAKQEEMQATVMSLNDALKTKESELKETIAETGTLMTQAKIEAHRREMDLVSEAHARELDLLAAAQAREAQLQSEMEGLRKLLQGEKESQRINKELMNRILKQRVEIDAELGELKKRFDQESKEWDAKYAQEQEARRLDVTRAQQEMEKLQDRAEAAIADAEERQARLVDLVIAKEKELSWSV